MAGSSGGINLSAAPMGGPASITAGPVQASLHSKRASEPEPATHQGSHSLSQPAAQDIPSNPPFLAHHVEASQPGHLSGLGSRDAAGAQHIIQRPPRTVLWRGREGGRAVSQGGMQCEKGKGQAGWWHSGQIISARRTAAAQSKAEQVTGSCASHPAVAPAPAPPSCLPVMMAGGMGLTPMN